MRNDEAALFISAKMAKWKEDMGNWHKNVRANGMERGWELARRNVGLPNFDGKIRAKN